MSRSWEVPLGERHVRYWHKADVGLRGVNVCFGGKAAIGADSHYRQVDLAMSALGQKQTFDGTPLNAAAYSFVHCP